MKQQLHIFLNAVMFFTRLPVPHWVKYNPEYLNKSTIYFPVIGWLVGLFTAVTFILSKYLSSSIEISIILSFVAGVLITGAFHEDGFADVCDGFGGGWDKMKILEIMKDSRVGAYGAIGLILIFLLKYFSFYQILKNENDSIGSQINILFIFICAHSLSRFTAATFIYSHSYVRENEDSKAKPVAKRISLINIILCGAFGFFPLLLYVFYTGRAKYFLIMLPLVFCKYFLGRYFQKWIGGYTGDCLGATQQVAEVIIYLSFTFKIYN